MSRTHHHGTTSRRKPWVKHPFGYSWAAQSPSWWTSIFMNRPKRAANCRLARKILLGAIDPDNTVFPLGNRKPHNYYR